MDEDETIDFKTHPENHSVWSTVMRFLTVLAYRAHTQYAPSHCVIIDIAGIISSGKSSMFNMLRDKVTVLKKAAQVGSPQRGSIDKYRRAIDKKIQTQDPHADFVDLIDYVKQFIIDPEPDKLSNSLLVDCEYIFQFVHEVNMKYDEKTKYMCMFMDLMLNLDTIAFFDEHLSDWELARLKTVYNMDIQMYKIMKRFKVDKNDVSKKDIKFMSLVNVFKLDLEHHFANKRISSFDRIISEFTEKELLASVQPGPKNRWPRYFVWDSGLTMVDPYPRANFIGLSDYYFERYIKPASIPEPHILTDVIYDLEESYSGFRQMDDYPEDINIYYCKAIMYYIDKGRRLVWYNSGAKTRLDYFRVLMRTDPDLCLQRIQKRSRDAEQGLCGEGLEFTKLYFRLLNREMQKFEPKLAVVNDDPFRTNCDYINDCTRTYVQLLKDEQRLSKTYEHPHENGFTDSEKLKHESLVITNQFGEVRDRSSTIPNRKKHAELKAIFEKYKFTELIKDNAMCWWMEKMEGVNYGRDAIALRVSHVDVPTKAERPVEDTFRFALDRLSNQLFKTCADDSSINLGPPDDL